MEEATIRRIDHISIAVRDLEKARAFFIGALGGRELFSAPVVSQKFQWTTIELGSSCFIELIDPLENEGFLHQFLETRGEGPHHITIQVDDIRKMHQRLQNKGVPTFGLSEPYPSWKEFYIHPKHAFGTLIQFAEFNPLDWVEPGYLPASYKEFVPHTGTDKGKSEIEVQRLKTEGEDRIEIHSGKETLQISEGSLKELIAALSKV